MQPIQVVGVIALARSDHEPMALMEWSQSDPSAASEGKGVAFPIRVMAAIPPEISG